MLFPAGSRPKSGVGSGARAGWRVADIEIDTATAQVTRRGRALRLERSGYELLRHLAAHAGSVVAKDELLRAGWPGRVVSENSLAKAIGKLRHALGDERGELIRAVHGYGYRLAETAVPLDGPGSEVAVAASEAGARAWPAASIGAWLLVALALASAAAWYARREAIPARTPDTRAVLADEDVIAILPLRDRSPDRSLGLLADGIANHLRDQMQRMPALRIVSRADSHAVRGADRGRDAIAAELGANLVVDGELSLVEDRLRVVLHLSDTRGRIPAWTRSFERPPYDQATLLEDLTAALLDGVGNQPERWGHDPARGRGTTNPEAYRTFLRAATLFAGNNDPNSQRRAIAVLEQAIELDPDYADALLMLGGILGGSGYYADSPEQLVAGRTRAFATMDRGIALAPDDPSNYLLRSEMRLLYRFDWDGAWADIEAAAARTPGGESAAILVWKARYLASLGRLDEAIANGARAIALDPQSGARRNQGWHYLGAGDTRNARAVLMLQLEDLPENPHTNFYLALCDIFEGQPEAALRRLELSSTLFRLVGTAIAQHERGDRAASDLALQKLTDQFAIADGYWVGAVHAWRGEHDAALHWIDRALRGGDSSAMYLPFDPLLRSLRADPRFAERLAALKRPAR
jgi:DNA-binding winged helix-turn-helix (wHTH) protein/TolB-like protein